MTHGHDWTAEEVETLRAMTAEHYGSSAIARALGVTRNAVIGKRKRLGIQSRIQPRWQRKTKSRLDATPAGAVVAVRSGVTAGETAEANVFLHPWPLATFELGRDQCRYVLNSEPPFMHCAAPGFPWCPEHARRVWRKAGSVER